MPNGVSRGTPFLLILRFAVAAGQKGKYKPRVLAGFHVVEQVPLAAWQLTC
jgi:hypothetical protein